MTGRNRNNDNEVIDLVNSPYLMIPGTVTLDSDEEIEQIRQKAQSAVDSPQVDCQEIRVKVKFNAVIETFPFRRVRIFSCISNIS